MNNVTMSCLWSVLTRTIERVSDQRRRRFQLFALLASSDLGNEIRLMLAFSLARLNLARLNLAQFVARLGSARKMARPRKTSTVLFCSLNLQSCSFNLEKLISRFSSSSSSFNDNKIKHVAFWLVIAISDLFVLVDHDCEKESERASERVRNGHNRYNLINRPSNRIISVTQLLAAWVNWTKLLALESNLS